MRVMAKQLLFIPGPVTCAPEVLAALAQPLIDHRGPEFAGILERVSRGMAPLFGTSAEVVVLGSSGTGGLEAAVASAFSPGERVLVAPVGVFGKRLAAIAATYGLVVEAIETPLGRAVDPKALAERLHADGSHAIAGILLTHNETSTGVQNELAPLAAAIGDHPATVIVDSVSGLGASKFEMDRWKFDIVVTASQKALGAPPGLAMVAVAPRGWGRIAAARAPRFYFDLQKAREFAQQGQTPWTPPVSLLFALETALLRYNAEGPEHVYARHDRYARAIRAFAAAAGIEVFSVEGAHSVTVVAMNAPAACDVAAVRKNLREVHGIVLGGGQAELKGKIFRMGTMGDLSGADVMRALDAFGSVLDTTGAKIDSRAGARAARAVLEEQFTTVS
jgi:aspartate aminotransferase-like enzyme